MLKFYFTLILFLGTLPLNAMEIGSDIDLMREFMEEFQRLLNAANHPESLIESGHTDEKGQFRNIFKPLNAFHAKESPIYLKAAYDIDVDYLGFVRPEKNIKEAQSNEGAKNKMSFCGFHVFLGSTQEKIGYVTVAHLSRSIHVTWLKIDNDHRQHGYSGEVLKTLEKIYAKKQTLLPQTCNKLWFETSTDNPMSTIATKAGYQQCSEMGELLSPQLIGQNAPPKVVIFVKNFGS